jgi:hypothetical protein
MARKLLAVGTVLALVLVGAGAAFVLGVGPAPGGDTSTDTESFPTETPGEEQMTDTQPFAFTTDSIEECGQTCRDVTSTLTNQQSTTADNVTVYTRLYAGNGTDGDVVWDGSESVGTLGAGESYTTTTRVELSYGDAYAIDQEDGWITIQTTVQTADRTVTFTEQRKVA